MMIAIIVMRMRVVNSYNDDSEDNKHADCGDAMIAGNDEDGDRDIVMQMLKVIDV